MGGSESTVASPPPALLWEPWRKLNWNEEEKMKNTLKKMKVRNPDVKYLRILVHGPVGAGRSSFIKSINSIFQGRITSGAIAESDTGCCFTKTLKMYTIRDVKSRDFLPFVICDTMGLEMGLSEGVHPDDIISVLQGQIKTGYKFNPIRPCSEKDQDFNSNPRLSDRIHCLVSVMPADKVILMGDSDFKEMKMIRKKAGEMDIPQFTILTRVDQACPEVRKDIKMIYRSKTIQGKMQDCSNKLGVTMNCIFPVKNYHEEIDLNPDMNVLLLSALKHILDSANDYVEMMAPPPANKRSNNSDP